MREAVSTAVKDAFVFMKGYAALQDPKGGRGGE
jgi:hypothetical protein